MDAGVGAGAGAAARAHHAGGAEPAPERRRRMAAGRKRAAVLRRPRGEAVELVSRALGVTAAELSPRREALLAGGAAALTTRPAAGREIERGRLKAQGGAPTRANEPLGAKIERLDAGRPLARRRSRR